MFAHGDPDQRPVKRWTIRKLMPVCGCGLLSGQWGAFKSFMALEIAAAVMTGQPFNTYLVRRQCGVLFLPAEGADEMRVRLEALVREKCGGVARAPFRWFEAVPMLLHPGGLELLIAMARQADVSLQQEFGLPLGLVFIDTVAASAGYAMQGAESDSAVGQQVMRVLRQAAEATDSFWCGIDHFGKDVDPGHPRQLQQGGSGRPGTGLPRRARTQRPRAQPALGGAQVSRRPQRSGISIQHARGDGSATG